MKLIEHFIDGKSYSGDSKRKGKVFNPATGEQSAEVKLATRSDTNKAIENAKKAFEKSLKPLHSFMLKFARDEDIQLFVDVANNQPVATRDEIPIKVLIPAFIISELRRAFEIGFLVFIPFLVIDMVVASVLMSMGMMMLPPIIIALPFKIIFFVLVDGWFLIVGSLVQSFGALG